MFADEGIKWTDRKGGAICLGKMLACMFVKGNFYDSAIEFFSVVVASRDFEATDSSLDVWFEVVFQETVALFMVLVSEKLFVYLCLGLVAFQ